MGLFDLLGKTITAPIKIAAAPITMLEDALIDDDADDLKPFNQSRKALTRAIEKAMKELDD